MHHIADPHVLAAFGQCAIVGLVIDAGPRLRDTEVHHVVAVIRVHALDPVIDRGPAVLLPAQQFFDLWPDVAEGHGFPVDAPGNGFGRLKQGFVNVAVGFD
ncbi:hypothetical protein D3C81_1661050 [compost metagenome]